MNRSPTVVITGSSAGLGRAIAHAFARRGAKLGLLARSVEALNAAKEECEHLGGQAIIVSTDVSDAAAVEHAAQLIEEEFGPIDIWINNAMVSVFSPIKEMDSADYKRVTEVAYLGYVHGTLSALRRMLPRDRGRIVQIGSALSYRSIPLQSAYCASKHAINGFTDSLRCELIHDRSSVQVTSVHMPAMNTPQFGWVKSRLPHNAQPVPPIFQPSLAAEVVVEAATAKRSRREYWVGTPTIAAIVGQRIIPALLDLYLGKTGYKAQQIAAEPRDREAPDNLYQTIPGPHQTNGTFDDRSSDISGEIFFSKHRALFGFGVVAIAGIGFAALREKTMTKEGFPGSERKSVNLPLLTATSAALLTLVPVLAHQMGVLAHLPDPPSRVFASDHITESNAAHPFGIPDGLLGVGSYGMTLTLALLAPHLPMIRELLAAKLIADGSLATVNVVRQMTSFGKLCSWCTATAFCTAGMLLAGREDIKALKSSVQARVPGGRRP